jgi:hypothetical protein
MIRGIMTEQKVDIYVLTSYDRMKLLRKPYFVCLTHIMFLGSYTNHEFVCKLALTSFDQMPADFDKHFYVEFTQPATTVSNCVLRSVSVIGGSGEPPEKHVKYLARHEYKLEIEFTEKQMNTYAVAAKLPVKEPTPPESPQGDPDFPEERAKDSDSDSD